jgi:peptide/nickel transport system substrate-binding protein
MSDQSARVSAMESGRIQAIEDVPYIDVKRLSGSTKTESVQSFGLLFLMFNTADKRFADKRVRQALHYALDTEKIISTAMVGNAEAATGYVPATHPDYHKAATVYTHDVARAKKLLADAGVKDLSFTVLTTDTGWVKDIAPLLKESWEAAGVEVTLDIAQSPAQYAKIDKGGFDVLVAPGDPSVFGNDADLLLRWFYYGFWPESRYGWGKSAAYKQVKQLLDKAAQAVDETKRKELWGQVTDLVADEAALYPILHRKLPTAWNEKALPGFKPLPTTGLSFLDVSRA